MSTDRHAPYPPDAVGQRMAVRRRLSDGRLTDTVGIVLERGDGTALLRDRRGRRHRIGDADVVAVTVPPTGAGLTPPHRRRAIDAPAAELVAVQAAGWAAAERIPLGDWTLRANGGYTSRANSALAVGDPGVALPQALSTVADHYRRRGLPAGVQLVPALDRGAAAAAETAGWSIGDRVAVMVADLADLVGLADLTGGGAGLTVDVADDLTAPWREVLEQREGVLPDDAVALLCRGTPGFALARDDGLPIGVVRGSLSDRWLGLTAVEVAPAARRRGAATALLAGLVDWAVARGAAHAWLQVAVDNTVARRVYAGLGFAEHHRYHYRWAP